MVQISIRLYVAALLHGVLIGLMIGLSTTPIVAVALPLILGAGGIKLLSGTGRDDATLGVIASSWIPSIWLVALTAALLGAVYVRTHSYHEHNGISTVSQVLSISDQEKGIVPLRVLVAARFDQLSLTKEEKSQVAAGISLLSGEDLAYLLSVEMPAQDIATRGFSLFSLEKRHD